MGAHTGERETLAQGGWVLVISVGFLVFLVGLWVGAANSHAVLRRPAPTRTVTVTRTVQAPAPPAPTPSPSCPAGIAKVKAQIQDLIQRTGTSSGAYYDEIRSLPGELEALCQAGGAG